MSEKSRYFDEYVDQPEKQMRALQHAVNNRQLEIDLYWKRTTYFWTISAATLAGYFVLATKTAPGVGAFATFAVACLGFIISLAWFFVNKGSKMWQENWENHVAAISNDHVGSLYKKVLLRPELKYRNVKHKYDWVTRPATISVSKVNQWVSLYVVCFWIVLIIKSSSLHIPTCVAYPRFFMGAFTAIFVAIMFCGSNTHLGPHEPVVIFMPSDISD